MPVFRHAKLNAEHFFIRKKLRCNQELIVKVQIVDHCYSFTIFLILTWTNHSSTEIVGSRHLSKIFHLEAKLSDYHRQRIDDENKWHWKSLQIFFRLVFNIFSFSSVQKWTYIVAEMYNWNLNRHIFKWKFASTFQYHEVAKKRDTKVLTARSCFNVHNDLREYCKLK